MEEQQIENKGLATTAAVVMGTIKLVSEIVDEAEKLKGYWDETGFDMHIAVKKNGMIAVSTKHWGRVHYIVTGKEDAYALWTAVKMVAGEVGRTLVQSEKGPYVYVPKLNVVQTQYVFDKLKEATHTTRVDKNIEWYWSIDDAVLP